MRGVLFVTFIIMIVTFFISVILIVISPPPFLDFYKPMYDRVNRGTPREEAGKVKNNLCEGEENISGRE